MNLENINLLIDPPHSKSVKRIILNHGMAVFTGRSKYLDISLIAEIVAFIKSIHEKYKKVPIPILFDLNSVEAIDKLSYILLEIIMFSLISDYKHKVSMKFKINHGITTEGIRKTPLVILGGNNVGSNAQFCSCFGKTDYRLDHLRKIYPKESAENGTLSRTYDEIVQILMQESVDRAYAEKFSEVIVELIGNAGEHNNATCLLDIDITELYRKKGDDGIYRGINVAIVSLAQITFGCQLIQKAIQAKDLNDRYEYLCKTYIKHSEFFNDEYSAEDFGCISAFQDRISEREKEYNSGGTGLTCLLKSLEEISDATECYMLTGARRINFIKELLEYDDDGWIGFNLEHSFSDKPPDKRLLSRSPLIFPGIAYNLNFVCRIDKKGE